MTDISEDLGHIAIVGMSGRFPGAGDVETFWHQLTIGNEGISTFSHEELRAAGVSPAQLAQPNYVKAKGVLTDADHFDATFFGLSPREAELMDPQHRVFLECAWAALENAGYDPAVFYGRIGLFAGSRLSTYLLFNLARNQSVVDAMGTYQTLIANDKDFLPTRVSYQLNLTGPSVNVQTACSTSLVAVHLACQSLLNGECDLALAGGVSVSTPLRSGYRYEPGGILSPDGRCRAFDAKAGGTVGGDGVGIVVLRRLADAARDHDLITAVIRGSAVNNDGSRKVGYTAPSVAGQTEVIAEALAMAGVEPETVGYIETHGTGTVLGDPIEIAALTQVFQERGADRGSCAIGSVKTNVGHLDAAAGVTALIKAALSLERQAIPPSLHFTAPNPETGLDQSPFFVNTEYRSWPRTDRPRRAAVSSFGIGGTNAHVVLEEAPAAAAGGPARPGVLLPLSAKSAPALADSAQRLADYLEQHPTEELADVAFTLAAHRRAFDHRQVVVGADRNEAIAKLRAAPPATGVAVASSIPPVAFLFPGQGSQYVNMARGLYEQEPRFRQELDDCAELFRAHLGVDLRQIIFPAPEAAGSAADRLAQTEFTQPALFAIEHALAQLWLAWGVRPRAMLGHSIGEYVAACVAGVFSLADAAAVVAARARLIQSMPPGSMLAVSLPEPELRTWLSDELSLAAVNSPSWSVVSGPTDAVAQLATRLAERGQAIRQLTTSHAFHSSMLDAAVTPFESEVRKVKLRAPRVPFCSNVTGTWITDEQATDPAYWAAHLRVPVRFADGLGELLREPGLVTLEAGPGRSLRTLARQHPAWRADQLAVASLRHPSERLADRMVLLTGLGELWQAGVGVDWHAFYHTERRCRRPLPTYPFQRRRYWVDPETDDPVRVSSPAPSDQPAELDEWTYCPGWRRLPTTLGEFRPDAGSPWLVLGAEHVLGRALADRIESAGQVAVRVTAGESFHRTGELCWSIDPGQRTDYGKLFEALRERELPAPATAVHLWSLASEPAPRLDRACLDQARRRGFDSLLALGQALGEIAELAPIELDVLCRGVFNVTGQERLQPENAIVLGPGTVIPQEVANVSCRVLDLAGGLTDPDPTLVAAVHDLAARNTTGTALARRGRHWWGREFDRVRLAEQPVASQRLRDRGVYLITGGLGGIGLMLAEHLARSVTEPVLALWGRSPFPAPEAWADWLASHRKQDPTSVRIRALLRLRKLGARPVVQQADVIDPDQVDQAVATLRRWYGRINGVIHAAGLPAGGLIQNRSAADTARVMAAKTHGTLVLDAACQADELDFFLLCSSLTAVLGGPGQIDYCAANAFLDAYAQWRQATGSAPIAAIGWDTWQETGMAAGLAHRLGATAAPATAIDHPLLHRRLVAGGDGVESYTTTLTTADSWIVDEHRIMGHGLVPGTAYLELVRAAVAGRADGREIELRDVLFPLPAIVPDRQQRELHTTLEPHQDGWRFRVRSLASDPTADAPSWQEHATGTVSFREVGQRPPRTLPELLPECEVVEVIDTEQELKHRLKLDLAEAGGAIQFAFGPRWRCLQAIHSGERALLAVLRLPDDYLSDLEDCQLHPALLDVAGAAARIHAGEGYYLPFWYRSVRVAHALTSAVHCLVRCKESAGPPGETLTCDIELRDPAGRLLVQVLDFTMKRINDVAGLLSHIEQAAAGPVETSADADSTGVLAALRSLSEGVRPAQAVEVFRRILATDGLPAQLVVSGRDLPSRQRIAQSIDPVRLVQEAERSAPPRATHPRPQLDTEYVAPATEVEQTVAAIWQEVLGIEKIGTMDDFFALGGHSLAAVQIGAKIRAKFGVDVALSEFFDAPTVANTARVLAAAEETGTTERIDRLHRDEPDELDNLDELSDEQVDAKLRELLSVEDTQPGSET